MNRMRGLRTFGTAVGKGSRTATGRLILMRAMPPLAFASVLGAHFSVSLYLVFSRNCSSQSTICMIHAYVHHIRCSDVVPMYQTTRAYAAAAKPAVKDIIVTTPSGLQYVVRNPRHVALSLLRLDRREIHVAVFA
jgi:hypothetical protein